MTLHDHYRRLRHEHPTTPARDAVRGARHAVAVDAVLAAIEWTEVNRGRGYGPFAIGALPDGAAIAVYEDDEPYDWGDIEPSDDERERLQVIGCAARIAGEPDDLDAVWGYGYLDDGSYLQWQREAVSFALGCGFFDTARRELAERAEWAARDVLTVD
jgi:hypothetical protein